MHHTHARRLAVLAVAFAPLIAACGAERARQEAADQEFFVEHHHASGGESVGRQAVAARPLPPTVYVFAAYVTPGAMPLGPIYPQGWIPRDAVGRPFPRARREHGNGWIAGVAVGTVLAVVVVGLVALVAAASSAVSSLGSVSSVNYGGGFPIGPP